MLIPILLPLLFFLPYLGGHVVPFGVDIVLLNYPLLSLMAHALRAGYPVLWNPYSGGGYPLAPFTALPFYAPTWLLAILPVTAAISWTYALDLAIGGLGAYALAAQVGVRPAARLVPTVAYPFSGFILAHVLAGHFLEVGLMSWFPVALAALHWALDAASPRPPGFPAASLGTVLQRGILCGGALAMLVLANGVSWLIFVGYPIVLVALALALRALRLARRRGAVAPTAIRCALALAVAGLVALLMSAVVLLPLQSLVGETLRGSGPMSFPRLTRTSEPLAGLVLSVAPGLFGSDVTGTYWFPNSDAYFQEVYAYIGLPILALALAGVVAGRRRGLVRLYAALAVLALALALGAQTPLYSLLYHLAPGFDVARTPARWMLVATLAVALLAGIGADALLGFAGRESGVGSRESAVAYRLSTIDYRLSPPTGLAALAALLLLGLLGIAVAAALPLDHARAALRGLTLGPALARLLVVALATALVLLTVAQLPRPAGAALLVVLVVADLWSANGPLIHPLDPAPYYKNAAVDLARAHEGTERVWSLDRALPLRRGMLDRRTFDIEDFAPLTLSDYYLFTHPGATLSTIDTGMARADDIKPYNGHIAALLGVSIVLSRRPLRDPGLAPLGYVRVPYYGVLKGDWSHPGPRPGPAYAYRVTARLPFALPLYATRAVPSAGVRAAVFAAGFDPLREALLDQSPAPVPSSNPSLEAWRRALRPARSRPVVVGPGVVRIGQTENSIVLRATMRRAGVLLLDQIYDKDWTAAVEDEAPGGQSAGHASKGGYSVPLRRADGLLTALPLAAGAHQVTLVYAPPSYLLGALLSLLGYALALGAALTGLRKRGPRRP